MTTKQKRFGVMAHREFGSRLGAAATPTKETDGSLVVFATEDDAIAQANDWNDRARSGIFYTVYRL